MKKTLLTLLLSLLPLAAANLVDPGTLQVRLVAPERASKIPMGSYLGTYTYPPANRYTVSANVEGFVTAIAIKPYSHVTKGEQLFLLKSPKLLDLQSQYISTMLEQEYYAKEVMRLKPLAAKGVVPTKRLIESTNKLEKLTASVAFQRDVLRTFGLSEAQLEGIALTHKPDPLLLIASPADGSIATLDVQHGSFVSQGDTLATLIDTRECHFEIAMPWRMADTLEKGEKLYSGEKEFVLFAKAPQIDPVSQTRDLDLHERGDCNGKGGASINLTLWRNAKAWKLPAASVVGFGDGSAVFVKRDGGFEPVVVTVLAQSEGFTYVDGPLKAGDRVAASAVLTLKSAAESGEE